jgi:hypothetical protein
MNNKLKIFSILLVPIIILLNLILRKFPIFVERYYSTTFNKFIREALGKLTNPLPFSVSEFFILLLVIYFLASIILLIARIKKDGFFNPFLSIASSLAVIYILFMLLWGFNYHRLSFDRIAGIKVEKSSKQELYELCDDLINKANMLRENVQENSEGVMHIPEGYKSVFKRAGKGFENVSSIIPELSGEYAYPKPIILSKWMSYTGITGFYLPFTSEANVNINQPDFELPFTAQHEISHKRGFAREDEANYIAYVTCINHPDVDFQYSGVMLALINSMNALAGKDFKSYETLANKYSDGVRRDLQFQRKFWAKYEGNISKISSNVNDKYLKSNGQEEGVESYGKMVDLLLAEYRSKKKL